MGILLAGLAGRGVQGKGHSDLVHPKWPVPGIGVYATLPTGFPLAGTLSGTRKVLSSDSRMRAPCASSSVYMCGLSGAQETVAWALWPHLRVTGLSSHLVRSLEIYYMSESSLSHF